MVPVHTRDFVWPEPRLVPTDIKEILRHNAIEWSQATLRNSTASVIRARTRAQSAALRVALRDVLSDAARSNEIADGGDHVGDGGDEHRVADRMVAEIGMERVIHGADHYRPHTETDEIHDEHVYGHAERAGRRTSRLSA